MHTFAKPAICYELYLSAAGSVMPYLIVNLVFGLSSKQAPWIVRPIARAIASAVNKGFSESAFQNAE